MYVYIVIHVCMYVSNMAIYIEAHVESEFYDECGFKVKMNTKFNLIINNAFGNILL